MRNLVEAELIIRQNVREALLDLCTRERLALQILADRLTLGLRNCLGIQPWDLLRESIYQTLRGTRSWSSTNSPRIFWLLFEVMKSVAIDWRDANNAREVPAFTLHADPPPVTPTRSRSSNRRFYRKTVTVGDLLRAYLEHDAEALRLVEDVLANGKATQHGASLVWPPRRHLAAWGRVLGGILRLSADRILEDESTSKLKKNENQLDALLHDAVTVEDLVRAHLEHDAEALHLLEEFLTNGNASERGAFLAWPPRRQSAAWGRVLGAIMKVRQGRSLKSDSAVLLKKVSHRLDKLLHAVIEDTLKMSDGELQDELLSQGMKSERLYFRILTCVNAAEERLSAEEREKD